MLYKVYAGSIENTNTKSFEEPYKNCIYNEMLAGYLYRKKTKPLPAQEEVFLAQKNVAFQNMFE